MIGRLLRLAWLGFLASIFASVIGAFAAKRTTVSVGEPEDDEVALAGVLEPFNFRSTAKAFRGGSLLLWMAGGDIDLRAASLDAGGATLSTRLIMGGGRILVPDTWRVTTKLLPIVGGIDARSVESLVLPADAPHLEITGWAFMGGFSIVALPAETPVHQAEAAVAEVVVKTTGKRNGRRAATVESTEPTA
jgi:hypothetical protein